MEKKSIREIISVVFKAVTLAMGVAVAEDLFETYGVLPEYYEDLGDGIYQVYVEVGGEIVPFVAVNSATGDYHG